MSILPILTILLTTSALSAGYQVWDKVKSRNGKCVANDGTERAVGEEWSVEGCSKQACRKHNNGNYYVHTYTCGARLRPGCRLKKGPGEYPQCCPVEVCNKGRMMKYKRNAEMKRRAYFVPIHGEIARILGKLVP